MTLVFTAKTLTTILLDEAISFMGMSRGMIRQYAPFVSVSGSLSILL